MEARIFYGNTPHPSLNKSWGNNVYKKIHYNDENVDVIDMPTYMFRKYYRMLPQKETVNSSDVERSLERIYMKYNLSDKNPLATDSGQAILKSKGLRHTSMMIGDVVKFDNKYYIVAGHGFLKMRLV